MKGSVAQFREWLDGLGTSVVCELAALREHQTAIDGLPWWEESAELGSPGEFSRQVVAGMDRLAELLLAAQAEIEVLRAARADAPWPTTRTPAEVAEDIDPRVIDAAVAQSETPCG